MREIALLTVALAILATLAFTPHVRHGGFYLDDWSNAVGALEPPGGPGLGNALSYFADLTIYRPVLVVYVPLLYFVFGMDMAAHLIWAAALGVFVAVMLYGVLRTLGVPWIHAATIVAFTIVYPWFDSIRFWATASQISLSVGLALAGLWIALAGLSRRSWRWHGAAATLYLLSILTYEVTLPLVAAAGVLYVLHGTWKDARGRWAVDLTIVVISAIWIGKHTARAASGLSAQLSHLEEIVLSGGTLLGRTAIPSGEPATMTALVALASLAVIAFVASRYAPERFNGGGAWSLRQWLVLGAGGLAVAALGWTMFIPADPYYTPSVYGMTNRVNGLAGIGLIIVVYASLGVVGSMAGAFVPRWRHTGVAITLVLATLLGAAYVDVLRRHIGIWNSAFAAETEALRQIKARFPRLPPETTMFVAGYPANQTLGVPILSTTWDFNGMLIMSYRDRGLAGYPLTTGFRLVCGREGVSLAGPDVFTIPAPYGKALLVDLATSDHARPKSRAQCHALRDKFVPGPLYLDYSY